LKTVDIIYSPVCEYSAAFIRILSEWLENKNVTVNAVSYSDALKTKKDLLVRNGIIVNDRLIESCFTEVFYKGLKIDSVPLDKEKIFSALGIVMDSPYEENKASVIEKSKPEKDSQNILVNKEIEWIPITKETAADEMSMCLKNYPFGNPAVRFHKQCREMKSIVFNEVWEKENCGGVYAKRGNEVVGLLEVFPREILKKHGFLTGVKGNDDEYLTVGCYEVGYRMPRTEIIDGLMCNLLMVHKLFKRNKLEGVGVFEWPDGFTPYWVYDKYYFRMQEKLTVNKVIMEKYFD
jgi:hypothetical protein